MNDLIILTGPTAVGKTNLSIRLAKDIGGSIISADSMQVYKGMDIGTAKITPEEMQGIPHYLIDIFPPEHEFNVVEFKNLAEDALRECYDRSRIPIITGGTGFYIQALLYDIDFESAGEDKEYRDKLWHLASTEGPEALHRLLGEVDPASAESIHFHNVKRVIRALEFHHLTGKTISRHNEQERNNTSPYNHAYFVLNDNRDRLYKRIEDRIDEMVSGGLVEEVSCLKDRGLTKDHVSMKGLGYKEIMAYLEGECSLEEAIYTLKRDTRHFAKRQLTWFNRERDVIWVNKDENGYDEDKILDFMKSVLKERKILR
ncbi:MAG: tRNA (adenosine(37)-N6)-dimethylallyltransferase MiaA [Lachnospiraceae bacterium]|nr:tRNA (adenosine(37)-N6)-dimethylallyltransferase MiaA [Lachnospiraceae bacterium]